MGHQIGEIAHALGVAQAHDGVTAARGPPRSVPLQGGDPTAQALRPGIGPEPQTAEQGEVLGSQHHVEASQQGVGRPCLHDRLGAVSGPFMQPGQIEVQPGSEQGQFDRSQRVEPLL